MSRETELAKTLDFWSYRESVPSRCVLCGGPFTVKECSVTYSCERCRVEFHNDGDGANCGFGAEVRAFLRGRCKGCAAPDCPRRADGAMPN